MRAATAAAALLAAVLLLAGAADAAGIQKIVLLALQSPQDPNQVSQVRLTLLESLAKFGDANPNTISFRVVIRDTSVLPAPANSKKWEGKKAGTYVSYDIIAILRFPSAEAFSTYTAWKQANQDALKGLPIVGKASFVSAAYD
ncbi:hypothetical protein MNEG_9463 [Monoraphidium neglectum]|uniref:Stress-response A/B barrel domain-containing protein n=1 Tax=Monoraphidium neglectum TaxID=145388 RepID=A0A0D2MVZ0_9CHLO|nr:hypothetical protein MNEG_9463 [Monoraphidium neglectum]KIY98500.1 hypothetical protein MNEG_9463 [Monoraphidium neglectum]|eukprot:XP_013897520.1 hypothetical protein MNEG_9463 [Monoraphidium neglectum]